MKWPIALLKRKDLMEKSSADYKDAERVSLYLERWLGTSQSAMLSKKAFEEELQKWRDYIASHVKELEKSTNFIET